MKNIWTEDLRIECDEKNILFSKGNRTHTIQIESLVDLRDCCGLDCGMEFACLAKVDLEGRTVLYQPITNLPILPEELFRMYKAIDARRRRA